LNIGQQYDLLVNEFSQHHIEKKCLYNVIQKYQDIWIHDESNAVVMFLYFLKQHDEDPDYIVIPRLERLSNKLTGLF